MKTVSIVKNGVRYDIPLNKAVDERVTVTTEPVIRAGCIVSKDGHKGKVLLVEGDVASVSWEDASISKVPISELKYDSFVGKLSKLQMIRNKIKKLRKGPKWESCVEQVKAKGTADNPYAVCTESVGRENEDASKTADTKPAKKKSKIKKGGAGSGRYPKGSGGKAKAEQTAKDEADKKPWSEAGKQQAENPTESYQSEEAKHDKAIADRDATVDKLLNEQIDRTFTPEYKSQATKQEAMGILMSQYFKWDGRKILEAMSSALEDSNFHTENQKVIEMINNLDKPRGKKG